MADGRVYTVFWRRPDGGPRVKVGTYGADPLRPCATMRDAWRYAVLDLAAEGKHAEPPEFDTYRHEAPA